MDVQSLLVVCSVWWGPTESSSINSAKVTDTDSCIDRCISQDVATKVVRLLPYRQTLQIKSENGDEKADLESKKDMINVKDVRWIPFVKLQLDVECLFIRLSCCY